MKADGGDDQAKTPEEQRLHRRVLFRTLQMRGESKKLYFTGHVRNLSLGGLFVQTTSPRPVGSKLRIQLPIERGLPPVETSAEVLWVQAFDVRSKTAPGMGLRFTELDARSARRIEMFLEASEAEARRAGRVRPDPGPASGESSDRG